MIRIILTAILIGWIDQLINQAVWDGVGWRPKWYLWGHFWSVHIVFMILFAVATWPYLHRILLMTLVEDISYWIIHPTENLAEKGPKAWINWPFQNTKLAGFYLPGPKGMKESWIPWSYVALTITYSILEVMI